MESPLGPPLGGVVSVDIDGRVSVYAPGAQDVLFLNETASQVWRLLDGTRDRAGVLTELASLYSVEASVIADDVDRTLSSFVAAGLVETPDDH